MAFKSLKETVKPRTPLSDVLAKADKGSPKADKKTNGFKVKVDEAQSVRRTLARDFMIGVEKNPGSTVTELYRKLDLNTDLGTQVQKELLEAGYVTKKRVGRSFILELTEKGKEAICSDGNKLKGKGLSTHVFCQQRIKGHHESLGYTAHVEKNIDGKSIDVLVNKGGHLIAYEVETSPNDHIVQNVIRDLMVGVNEVVIVSEREQLEKIQRIVEKGVADNDLRKVSYQTIDDYLGE
ncbi:MAG: hypothetical protein JW765_05380 [Deltaproteobacteria bacterium]|nr:hypothetical protein [Candidatus Zymogenaceae bacterium]